MEALLDPKSFFGTSIIENLALVRGFLVFGKIQIMSSQEQVLQQIAVNTQRLNSLEEAISFHKKLMWVVIFLAGITLLLNKC